MPATCPNHPGGPLKHIDVVGAAIVLEGRVLCVRRGGHDALTGKWEFPGGKIEIGETPRDALAREIFEELRCHITVGEKVTTTTHAYEFATVTLTTYLSAISTGRPTLTEHTEMLWLAPSDLHALDWAPADVPAVALIEEVLATPPD